MKQKLKCAATIALPLLVGGFSSYLTGDAMARFGAFNQPPLAPPGWLFPVVWTVLYLMMGIASWLILSAPVQANKNYGARARFGSMAFSLYSISSGQLFSLSLGFSI